ncbi:MAG: winged helix-turn-helix domain-containing protein [Pseudomonadota bacterium]
MAPICGIEAVDDFQADPFRLEAWHVDPGTRQVQRDGHEVRLSPKAMGVLLTLVRAGGSVVSRDAMFTAVWPDVTVGDEVLTTAVAELRRAFGDSRRAPRVIETVQKQGYRLLLQPMPLSAPHHPPLAPTADMVPAVALGRSILDPEQSANAALDAGLVAPGAASVAVLPFQGHGESQARLAANGISRDISATLSRSRQLFVTRIASAAVATATSRDPVDVAARLGVRYIVEGEVFAFAGRQRISAALIDTRNGGELWADHYDCPTEDVFAIIDEVAQTVALAVAQEIDIRERRLAALRPISSLDAWGLFHRAQSLMTRFDGPAMEEAAALLSTASRLAPGSSRILAARATVSLRRHLFLAGPATGSQDLADALRLGAESAAIDPRDPHAHLALARANGMSGALEEAEARYLHALELNPNDALSHYFFGYHRFFGGHTDEAMTAVQQAKRLSPLDPMMFGFLGLEAQLHVLAGDLETAAAVAERAVSMSSSTLQSRVIGAWILERTGRHAQALRLIETVRRERPDLSRGAILGWFRFADQERAQIDAALERLGL